MKFPMILLTEGTLPQHTCCFQQISDVMLLLSTIHDTFVLDAINVWCYQAVLQLFTMHFHMEVESH